VFHAWRIGYITDGSVLCEKCGSDEIAEAVNAAVREQNSARALEGLPPLTEEEEQRVLDDYQSEDIRPLYDIEVGDSCGEWCDNCGAEVVEPCEPEPGDVCPNCGAQGPDVEPEEDEEDDDGANYPPKGEDGGSEPSQEGPCGCAECGEPREDEECAHCRACGGRPPQDAPDDCPPSDAATATGMYDHDDTT